MVTETRTERWYEPGKGAITPWGSADYRVTYALGIDFYGTPSHGGFYLNAGRERELEDKFREHGITAEEARMGYQRGWYEEDCSALAVLFTWPKLFPDSKQSPEDTLDQLKYWLKQS